MAQLWYIEQQTPNKMYKKQSFIVCLFLSFSFSLVAQKNWSLDACIDYAMTHNLRLNNYGFAAAANKESYRQSVRELLPSIQGISDYNINYGRSTDPNSNDITNTDFFTNTYSINASIAIFNGFQKLNTIRATQFLHKAAQEDLVQQKYLLAFRVMSAYYDIQFYKGLLANSKEQSLISKTNYELVKKQIELGLKAAADLYEAESLVLTDDLFITQNKNALETAYLVLMREMNYTETTTINLTPFLVPEDALINTAVQQDTVYKTALGFVPMIKAQQFRLDAAKKDLARARGNLSPSLSLSAGYGTGFFETNIDAATEETIPFRTQIKDNTSSYVGATLRIPISDKWSRRSFIKQKKIALSKANNQLAVQSQELFNIIQKLVQDHRSIGHELRQSYKKMETQEVAFTIAQKRYEKGMINTLELTQAKTLYATAQNENLQLRLREIVNKSTLDFYRGISDININ